MSKSDTFTNIRQMWSFKYLLFLPVGLFIFVALFVRAEDMPSSAVSPGNVTVFRSPPAQRGVALGLFRQEPNWNYKDFVTEIQHTGANYMAIVVSNYMKTNLSNEIYDLQGYTAPLHTVEKTIRQAQKQNMNVFLFPILRVEDKSNGGWRGTLAPTDEDAFFENYTRYIVRYAKLAQKLQVPLMSVGSELSTMDIHTERWHKIIEEVRKVYHGKLTYSANWDHYPKVAFFDRLDYAGVTGYFQLEDTRAPVDVNPPIEKLVHSWREIYFKLMRWQNELNKPLIFTEVGYLSQQGAASRPWAEGADEKVDLEIQRRCYEAFIRVWDNEDRLAGVYFWNWFDWEGENDREYTPREKPAADEMRKWFSASEASPTQAAPSQ